VTISVECSSSLVGRWGARWGCGWRFVGVSVCWFVGLFVGFVGWLVGCVLDFKSLPSTWQRAASTPSCHAVNIVRGLHCSVDPPTSTGTN